jgi:hypothetical protein
MFKVVGPKAGFLGDAGEDLGAKLLVVVIREDDVEPAFFREGFVGAGSSLNRPTGAQERSEDSSGFWLL